MDSWIQYCERCLHRSPSHTRWHWSGAISISGVQKI